MQSKWQDLSALTIVNTRPVEQATGLTKLLERQGAKVIESPVIEITGLTDTLNSNLCIKNLNKIDILIFISANAVNYFLKLLSTYLLGKKEPDFFPKQLRLAAVGRSTERVIKQKTQQILGYSIDVDIVPEQGSDSEALLKHSAFNECSGKKILIVRGQGGREYLAEQLRSRGAQVDYLEVYQRTCPIVKTLKDSRKLLDIWQKNKIDFIIITSTEGLVNLLTIMGGALNQLSIKDKEHKNALSIIAASNILVVHQKIAVKARQLGFMQNIIVAEQANNEAIVEALSRYCK